MTNNTNKLSVIIPLHNTGGDFHIYVESLITQAWTTLKITIASDGSTNNSAEITEHYAEGYPHVRLPYQANSGAPVVRDRGVKIATGKYAVLVDIDDEIYPIMYETLMTMALEDDLDVAQRNANWCFCKTGKV